MRDEQQQHQHQVDGGCSSTNRPSLIKNEPVNPPPLRKYQVARGAAPLMKVEKAPPALGVAEFFVFTKGCISNRDAFMECLDSASSEPDTEFLEKHRERADSWIQQAIQSLSGLNWGARLANRNHDCFLPDGETPDPDRMQLFVGLPVRIDTMTQIQEERQLQQQLTETNYLALRDEIMVRELAKQIFMIQHLFLAGDADSRVHLHCSAARLRHLSEYTVAVDLAFVLRLTGICTRRVNSQQWYNNDAALVHNRQQTMFMQWLDQAEIHLPECSQDLRQFNLNNAHDTQEMRAGIRCNINGFAPTNLLCEEHYAQNDYGQTVRSENRNAELTMQQSIQLEREIMQEHSADYAHVNDAPQQPVGTNSWVFWAECQKRMFEREAAASSSSSIGPQDREQEQDMYDQEDYGEEVDDDDADRMGSSSNRPGAFVRSGDPDANLMQTHLSWWETHVKPNL